MRLRSTMRPESLGKLPLLHHLPIVEGFEQREKRSLAGRMSCQLQPLLGQQYQAHTRFRSSCVARSRHSAAACKILFVIFPKHCSFPPPHTCAGNPGPSRGLVGDRGLLRCGGHCVGAQFTVATLKRRRILIVPSTLRTVSLFHRSIQHQAALLGNCARPPALCVIKQESPA
jgi:hypothetical protein